MTQHRRLFFGLALSALMGLMAGEARAGLISMAIDLGGGPVSIDGFATVDTANNYSIDVTGLNGALAAAGSAYQFSSLGGDSNQGLASNALEADLNMHGGVFHQPGIGGGNFFLQVYVFQDGWASPTGTNGNLMSSSTGNFNNQVAGAGHTAVTDYNPPAIGTPGAPTAGPYNVFATAAGGAPGPDPEGNSANAVVSPVTALFALQSSITFGLTPNGTLTVTDGFSVNAQLTASGVIPEPSSIVLMVTSMPLPLVVVGILRRRRRTAA